jgi:predicted dehydrogenase
VEKADGTVEKLEAGKIATNEEGGQTHSGVIDAFVEAITEGKPLPIPGQEGLKALEVVLAALESAAQKRSITIS